MCWTCFKDEAQFHLPGYINSQTARYGVLKKTTQHCMKTLWICRTAFSAHCLKNGVWEICSLNRVGPGVGGSERCVGSFQHLP